MKIIWKIILKLNINLNNLNEKEDFVNDLFSIKNDENIDIISS